MTNICFKCLRFVGVGRTCLGLHGEKVCSGKGLCRYFQQYQTCDLCNKIFKTTHDIKYIKTEKNSFRVVCSDCRDVYDCIIRVKIRNLTNVFDKIKRIVDKRYKNCKNCKYYLPNNQHKQWHCQYNNWTGLENAKTKKRYPNTYAYYGCSGFRQIKFKEYDVV